MTVQWELENTADKQPHNRLMSRMSETHPKESKGLH